MHEFVKRSDTFGRIEEAGVEHIPDADRTSRPANLFAVFFGGNLALSVIVFGWIPVTLGLSFGAAVASSAVGLTLGLIVTAPLALLGPRTGTNNTVSSSAHFGIRGRLIGSVLTLLFAVAYAAIAVWTSGDALVAAAHRLVGTPDGDLAYAIGYGVIALEIVVVALFGHATVVALQKVVLPVVGVLLLLGVVAYADGFDPSTGGEYALGGFWSTWTLAVAISIGGPLSYAPTLGDYTRRISQDRYSDRAVVGWTTAGLFLGLFATSVFGAFTATALPLDAVSYVAGLVDAAPGWYVLPLLLVALAGGLGQGVLNLYASGLDLEALFPRLRRVHTTLITSAVAVLVLYLGVFAWNAVDAITAMTLVLNGLAGPWVAVLLLGFLGRDAPYDPQDLQAFAQGRRGRYWFVGGWNLRAVAAFAAGSAFGLLSVATSLYVGPLADLAGGIDVSVVGSMIVAGAAYLLLGTVMPAPAEQPQPAHEEVAP